MIIHCYSGIIHEERLENIRNSRIFQSSMSEGQKRGETQPIMKSFCHAGASESNATYFPSFPPGFEQLKSSRVPISKQRLRLTSREEKKKKKKRAIVSCYTSVTQCIQHGCSRTQQPMNVTYCSFKIRLLIFIFFFRNHLENEE